MNLYLEGNVRWHSWGSLISSNSEHLPDIVDVRVDSNFHRALKSCTKLSALHKVHHSREDKRMQSITGWWLSMSRENVNSGIDSVYNELVAITIRNVDIIHIRIRIETLMWNMDTTLDDLCGYWMVANDECDSYR